MCAVSAECSGRRVVLLQSLSSAQTTGWDGASSRLHCGACKSILSLVFRPNVESAQPNAVGPGQPAAALAACPALMFYCSWMPAAPVCLALYLRRSVKQVHRAGSAAPSQQSLPRGWRPSAATGSAPPAHRRLAMARHRLLALHSLCARCARSHPLHRGPSLSERGWLGRSHTRATFKQAASGHGCCVARAIVGRQHPVQRRLRYLSGCERARPGAGPRAHSCDPGNPSGRLGLPPLAAATGGGASARLPPTARHSRPPGKLEAWVPR